MYSYSFTDPSASVVVMAQWSASVPGPVTTAVL